MKEAHSEKLHLQNSGEDVYSYEVELEGSDTNTDAIQKNFFSYFRYISRRLDSFGVETRGIERVPSYERSTNVRRQFLLACGLWLSAAGGLSSMSVFFLGPLLFDLSLRQSLIAGQIPQLIGCAVAAYLSLMGPKSGCRQMVGARYLFGWYFVRLIALCAIIGVIGWSVVNSVVGGQILNSVSDGKVSLVVGIIIICVISLVVAVFGIKQVLKVEMLLSLPVFLGFMLLYICAAWKYGSFVTVDSTPDHETTIGNSFSFASVAYSTTATWGSISADYYLLFPEDTSDTYIFMLTFFGLALPTTFVSVLGTLIGNIALGYQPWGDVYNTTGMGGLLHQAFIHWGKVGKFFVMLLFLSLISNNIINNYSAAFGIQLASSWLRKIPRWFWAIIVTCITLVGALVGRNEFSTILGNFLPMIGYWISMYFVLLLEENTIFRTARFHHLYTKEFPAGVDSTIEEEKPSSTGRYALSLRRKKQYYNWNCWNDQSRLTHGLAATFSSVVGAVGAALGMSQAYYVGPIAKAVGGEFGGDVGMWVCMGIAGLLYPPLRYLELKRFGR
ncbi:hypothetical protein BABINDRAFT_168633 [Babjeviella inositovora NRRL Y-12698]|uniref:Purine-cytosine permease n=1 Tax=Babjeviella inositovora NRRL Y-12698 TaxID=984486 RepID=A0A1E3QK45_9ASCO|nr:uncharacterized protein BABINDRAFT_168633 [Babjeviella inositovora NRRL Y-12698]ODQ78055.1 hypothetical protein BABINDRAFT_168633 [Babjeviella inositovora NRRL Y-12698]